MDVVTSRTSPTLLARLSQKPMDPRAWRDFVDRYGGKILVWCRQYRLQDADARDVTQEVLTNLVRRMQTFVYDPSRGFRAWLRTLTHHAWADFVEKRRRQTTVESDAQHLEQLQTAQAGTTLLERLQTEFERELFEEALARTRLRASAENWEAFRLLVFEQRPAGEVANSLGKSIASVYMAKSRITRMVREEVCKLERDGNGMC